LSKKRLVIMPSVDIDVIVQKLICNYNNCDVLLVFTPSGEFMKLGRKPSLLAPIEIAIRFEKLQRVGNIQRVNNVILR
jgi:hypothetical protein